MGLLAASWLVGCTDDPSRWNPVRGVWSIEQYVRTAAGAECGAAMDDVLDDLEQRFLVTEGLVGGVHTDLWVRSCASVQACLDMAEGLRDGNPPETSSSYTNVALYVDPIAETEIELEGCTVTRPRTLVFVESSDNRLTVTERSIEDFDLEMSSGCTEEAARAALPDQCSFETILTGRLATSLPDL